MIASVHLSYSHVHVSGADVGPSEIRCKECKFFTLPTALEPGETLDLCASAGDAFCHSINAQPVVGASLWLCYACARGVVVTW